MTKPNIIVLTVGMIGVGIIAVFVFIHLVGPMIPQVVVHAINQQRDIDVTTSTNYNFSSFAGTVWKTKAPLAIEQVESYKGKQALVLFTSQFFDTNDPNYTSVPEAKMIRILPVGTRIRIEHLIEDHGLRGGVDVFGAVLDGTNTQSAVELGREFFSANWYVAYSSPKDTNWGANTNLLETP